MKKCPRCNHELNHNDKFCPHCGLDLDRKYIPIKPKKKSMNYVSYIIILLSFFTIPMMYTQLLTQVSEHVSTTQSETMTLKKIQDITPTQVVAAFDTLVDFQNTFTNVDDIIVSIHNYEKALPSAYTFDKSYKIYVLNNYDVRYDFEYTTKINERLSLTISKECNRGHDYDNETYVIKKTQVTAFDDLFLDKNEEALIKGIVGEHEEMDKVVNDFYKRKDEFEAKREKLGHYGIGNYDEKASFVVKRYQDTLTSTLTFHYESNKHI